MTRWLALLFLGLVGMAGYVMLTRPDDEPGDLTKEYWGYD